MEKLKKFCDKVEDVSHEVLTLINVMDYYRGEMSFNQVNGDKEFSVQMYDLFCVINKYAEYVEENVKEILEERDSLESVCWI